jgi:hypothetical protein
VNAPYGIDYQAAPGTKKRHTVVMAPSESAAVMHVKARHPVAIIRRVYRVVAR